MMTRFANPAEFLKISRPVMIGCGALAALLIPIGTYWGLAVAPSDYQQGDAFRIMFVHVPAAWWSLGVYMMMAGASFSSFFWRHPVADLAARAAAPVGAAFTALALVTGAIWGKPMWGAWWQWDARLTSVLVLFFIYLGYMALWAAIEDEDKAARAASVFCLFGLVNIPIVKFSVEWWDSLHQGPSIRLELCKKAPDLVAADAIGAKGCDLAPQLKSSIHPDMLGPLILMGLGFGAVALFCLIAMTRAAIYRRRVLARAALSGAHHDGGGDGIG